MLRKLSIIPAAVRQMDARTLWHIALYRLKLRSGLVRLRTPIGRGPVAKSELGLRTLITPANESALKNIIGTNLKALLAEADEILAGKVRLFGGAQRELQLAPGCEDHWTAYHGELRDGSDIKPVWEAGRFCWATVLARAYWLSGNDERYAEGFWRNFETFDAANPRNQGPHWSSAQEVALRLISWSFCYSLLARAGSTTNERRAAMARSLAEHAERIPPTLDYALAQNNNHLLSEALGLYTAGAMLPEHPAAAKWKKLGLALFAQGIEKQVHADGAYAQHSSNYHRLALQLGLWAAAIMGDALPGQARAKLNAATGWLAHLLDTYSGRVPNLGPNDGAYILPLSTLGFEDFRPVLQAAAAAFSDGRLLPAGAWDEMGMWLGLPSVNKPFESAVRSPIRIEGKDSWAYLRTAQFKERPGHADQLNLDLWWRGYNLAMDAGTYLYNAPAPWDNALAATRVHNTLTVEDRDQMRRAGRFLWLDWAQAKRMDAAQGQAVEHDGYRRFGLTHRREVEVQENRWIVKDTLIGAAGKTRARLQWLLPDWPWRFEAGTLVLDSPHGPVQIAVDAAANGEVWLVRAGEVVHGSQQPDHILGWISHTYGVKEPALSFNIEIAAKLPISFTTVWTLP